jgi:hypothetical protein
VESIGFESAVFRLLWRGVSYVVLFSADGVFVSRARECDGRLDELARYAVGEWRPCVTHARELVRIAAGGPVAGRRAKRRRVEARAALRLVGE